MLQKTELASASKLPPLQYIRECFSYDPETGKVFWKTRPAYHFRQAGRANYFNLRFAGQEFGAPCETRPGYFLQKGTIFWNGTYRNLICARIGWELTNGEITDGLEVDHKDGNPQNNKLSNLRLATRSQQIANTKNRCDKHDGLPRGIRRNGSGFMARAHKNGKTIHLGTFKTVEEANAVYLEASRKLHGEFFKHYNSLEPSE